MWIGSILFGKTIGQEEEIKNGIAVIHEETGGLRRLSGTYSSFAWTNL